MWISLLCQLAFGGDVRLHVGVHREAGTIFEVAADGAAGQCRVLGMSLLVCPASGPVRFRWGGDPDFTLVGEVEIHPDHSGTAFVLPPNGSRMESRKKLAEPTVLAVQEVFLRTGDRQIPIPSLDLFDDLLALTTHEDWRIRREAVRGLLPFVRHTASDPFPADAPSLIPEGVLLQLARDPSKHVRRRVLQLLREMASEDPRATEAQAAVDASRADQDRRVRKLATVVQSSQVKGGMRDPIEAWLEAMGRVEEPGPTGRAACNALAQLHDYLPEGSVDPDRALGLVLRYHPEKAWRVWAAWRVEVPFHAGRLRYLLDRTMNLSMALFRTWGRENPTDLAAVLSDWEPGLPHSRRFGVIRGWLEDRVDDPILLRVLTWDDTMSGELESVPDE